MNNEEYIEHNLWEKQQDEIINNSKKYQDFCKEIGSLYDLKFNRFADLSKHGRIKINGYVFHLAYYTNDKIKIYPLEATDELNIRKFLKELSFCFSKEERVVSPIESFVISTQEI